METMNQIMVQNQSMMQMQMQQMQMMQAQNRQLEGKLEANKMDGPAPAGDMKQQQGSSGPPSGNEQAFWEMLKSAGPAP